MGSSHHTGPARLLPRLLPLCVCSLFIALPSAFPPATTGSVMSGSLSGDSVNATHISPQPSGDVIDGAAQPHLIPDERAYHVVLMTAAALDDEPIEVKARAASVTAMITRRQKRDATALAAIANRYAAAFRELDADSLGAHDEAAYQQRRRAALVSTQRELALGLSELGSAYLRVYVENEKRAMKLYPIPNMSSHQARLWDRLSAPWTLHAQGMNPYATTYTNYSLSRRTLYVTGVTDAGASCGCHQSRASVRVQAPAGQAFNTSGVGSAYAQTTTVYTLADGDFTDGGIEAIIDYYSFCPIINYPFINRSERQWSPLRLIKAYYRYNGNHVYVRCRPKGEICDDVDDLDWSSHPQYALVSATQIDIRQTRACIGKLDAEAPNCSLSDPKP